MLVVIEIVVVVVVVVVEVEVLIVIVAVTVEVLMFLLAEYKNFYILPKHSFILRLDVIVQFMY